MGRKLGFPWPDEPLGSSGFRSSRALALASTCVLALCIGVLVLTLESSGDVAAPAWPVKPSSVLGPPSPAGLSSAGTSSDRTPVAELSTQGVEVARAPVALELARPETLVYGSLLGSYASVPSAWSASVSFVDRSGARHGCKADQAGAYALRELEFGTYWVTARGEGYCSHQQIVELSEDRPLMRKDFALQKAAEVRVKVKTPEGGNLVDILKSTRAPQGARLIVAVATREPPGPRIDEGVGAATASAGTFWSYGPRVEKLPPDCLGLLQVECGLPAYVSLVMHGVVLETKRVERDQDEVSFTSSAESVLAHLATIRVRVVDAETGIAVARARVTLRRGSYADHGVATDSRGLATIEHREPGNFDLHVRAPGYEHAGSSIDARPGETTELGTFALEKELTVQGRIFDLEDRPLAASVAVGVLDRQDGSVGWLRNEEFRSAGDGVFRLRGLGRREYVIRAGSHDAAPVQAWEGVARVSGNVLVDTRGGSISDLEVHLRPASTLVLRATDVRAAGMRVRVVDERGLEWTVGRMHGWEPQPLKLLAGNYWVSLLDAQSVVRWERSISMASGAVELDLTLSGF